MRPLVGSFTWSFYESMAHPFHLSLGGITESKIWKGATQSHMIYYTGHVSFGC